MTLPLEFERFDLQICLPEQVDFYKNKVSQPFACTYRGMGTFWVICQSLQDNQKYYLRVLGGQDDYVREENHTMHLQDETEPMMSASECIEKLADEIEKMKNLHEQ